MSRPPFPPTNEMLSLAAAVLAGYTPFSGQETVETDTGLRKVGDGVTQYRDLTYLPDPATADLGGFTPRELPSYVLPAARNRFDPRQSLYNWKPSNTRRLRSSLGKAHAGAGIAHHLFIGDSETDSYVGTYDQLNMWPRIYRSTLTSLGVPSGGEGWVKCGGFSPTTDPRWTYASGVALGTAYASFASPGTAKTFTLIATEACTNIDLVLSNKCPSTMTYTVDGGGAQTFTPSGANSWATVALSGLSAAVHTIVITTGTSAGTYAVAGADCYNASGLLVHNAAQYGRTSADFATVSSFATVGTVTQQVTANPDVVWCALGVNDYGTALTVASLVANLTTIRAFWPTADFILVAQYERGDKGNIGLLAGWAGYVQALYTLADTLDVPLLDLFNRSGGYTAANGNGLMAGDTIHPTKAAQREWGRAAALLAAS